LGISQFNRCFFTLKNRKEAIILAGVSKEQIEKARQMNALTYLQIYEPNSIRKCGSQQWQLVEHDSLKLSNDKWFWFSQRIGGASALDFLVKVRGMDFVNAVNSICGNEFIAYTARTKPKVNSESQRKDFILPKKHRDNFKVIAYLQSRGIDREIIDRCIADGKLYESEKYHSCVFVGTNTDNEVKFACLRGTSSTFKQDIEGSSKQYGFTAPTKNADKAILIVCESPIDVLAQATLDKKAGLVWDKFQRLSLGGISDAPLMKYLENHSEIDSIALCLDNDKAGQTAALIIKNKLEKMNEKYKVLIAPPFVGKDYNEMLIHILKEEQGKRKLQIEVSR